MRPSWIFGMSKLKKRIDNHLLRGLNFLSRLKNQIETQDSSWFSEGRCDFCLDDHGSMSSPRNWSSSTMHWLGSVPASHWKPLWAHPEQHGFSGAYLCTMLCVCLFNVEQGCFNNNYRSQFESHDNLTQVQDLPLTVRLRPLRKKQRVTQTIWLIHVFSRDDLSRDD